MHIKRVIFAALISNAMLIASVAIAGQPLETETARLPSKGRTLAGSSYEFQSSSEGRETAWPWIFEYGLTNRIELAIEPVAHASIHPNSGRRTSGFGDLEATATFLVGRETASRPAIAIAAEVKLPLAKDRLLGTGKTDFAGYLIVSRKFAKVDIHGNVGYTILGRPAGVNLNNIFSFAVASEYHADARWDLVGELFANTTAAPGLGESGSAPKTLTEQTAELAGGEAFMMLGSRLQVSPRLSFDFGVVYDNNNAILVRPGFTLEF
jgi:hypothetical protein